MSAKNLSLSGLRQQWRACRKLLPEALRIVPVQEPVVKRILIFSGMLFGVGMLGMVSFRVRELIAALLLFSVGFGILFLIGVVFLLVQGGVQWTAMWLRMRTPQWNQAGRDWVLGFAHLLRGQHLWPRWTQKLPATAVPSTRAD